MVDFKPILALALTLACAAAADIGLPKKALLTVPSKVSAPYEEGKTNYVIIFGITNQTTQLKKIVAHQTSCGCTSLQATKTELAPGEIGKIKIELHTLLPTAKAAYLIDESTNWYATQIEIGTAAQMPKPK